MCVKWTPGPTHLYAKTYHEEALRTSFVSWIFLASLLPLVQVQVLSPCLSYPSSPWPWSWVSPPPAQASAPSAFSRWS